MGPGDLVSPRRGAGFSWWRGLPFLVIEREGDILHLIYPLIGPRGPIKAHKDIFRHISEELYEEG